MRKCVHFHFVDLIFGVGKNQHNYIMSEWSDVIVYTLLNGVHPTQQNDTMH